MLLGGCGTSEPVAVVPDAGVADTGVTDAGADLDASLISGVRGDRYCEVLVGTITGADVVLDVYNTYGLNDCPEAAFRALDVATLRTELMTPAVVLNGPRYWLMDAFIGSSLLDPTVRSFGGIDMRLAGRVTVPLSVATAGAQPYTDNTITRDTTVIFAAGSRVFELVDPTGRIFDMQSYTVQNVAQTEASLETLGERLPMLPAAWAYRTRVLGAELRIVAAGGHATVVQDELGNTYQLSAQ
jgi:hypothetical protein